MSKDETEISEQAKAFIKGNKKLLIETFANDAICPSMENPSTVLMAGSPGAGKTEFSQNLIKQFQFPVVRIDADEVRRLIPQYTGRNSDEVQGAASLGVEKLYDYVLSKNKSAIIDGTLANYEASSKNIRRSLDKSRPVAIFYIYQDPLLAWKFTQIREKAEGRYVPKDAFVDAFFKARENVMRASEVFGGKIQLFLVKKNYSNDSQETHQISGNIDSFLEIPYSKEKLLMLL